MDDKKTILYVDDEQTNLMLFKYNFQKKYNVITAVSGQEGLKLLRSNSQISVLISDMRMPEMNGLDLIKAVKSEYPNVICVLLTGFDISTEIEEAINSELIYKYLGKPFRTSEMEEILIKIL